MFINSENEKQTSERRESAESVKQEWEHFLYNAIQSQCSQLCFFKTRVQMTRLTSSRQKWTMYHTRLSTALLACIMYFISFLSTLNKDWKISLSVKAHLLSMHFNIHFSQMHIPLNHSIPLLSQSHNSKQRQKLWNYDFMKIWIRSDVFYLM